MRCASSGGNDPDVAMAAAIGGEGDLFAVGRPGGIDIEGRVGGKAAGSGKDYLHQPKA